ncbi:MAG TPA: pyruvate dehydrogenase (acetyl-transferring) E1 component subunit alpha [Steroidobacteraceae bacterium]|nr:pyruvate dehydrogenase (acetyl-transferring) E1 component subunit alpha [Steroidobacteraceae bacterium]
MTAMPPPVVTREHGLHLLSQMLRIRCFEDRCAELYSAGKIRGFLHLYNGEEAVAVGVMQSLQPVDAIAGTYREHGHALARGIGMRTLMAELLGKEAGCCRGRGGSMHIFDAATRFYGGNAIVGGSLPLAIGLGLAEKLHDRKAIAVCFFGEGAVAEGEFHESMNLAALWSLPVLFVCENNYYAMGTAWARSEVQTSLLAKVAGYCMRGESIDGMDVLAVETVANQLVRDVRAQRTPAFLEARTYRFRAHSMYDPQLYRSKDEVKGWEERGPLIRLTSRLKEAGLMTEDDFQRLQSSANAEVDDAVQFAEQATIEPVEELQRFVYAEETL